MIKTSRTLPTPKSHLLVKLPDRTRDREVLSAAYNSLYVLELRNKFDHSNEREAWYMFVSTLLDKFWLDLQEIRRIIYQQQQYEGGKSRVVRDLCKQFLAVTEP